MKIACLAIGIVTLFLTSFMLVYYGYLFKHTDHDVSFFFSVGIISVIMNLFTNMSASAAVLSIVYLVIAVAFLGVGFAIDASGSVAFYRSIGSWFGSTFGNKKLILWEVLSFLIPIAGIILYFVNYKSNREVALAAGKACLWGLLIELLLVWMIVGSVFGFLSAIPAAV